MTPGKLASIAPLPSIALAAVLALSACGRTTSSDTAATASTPVAPTTTTAPVAANPSVGGAAMLPTNTIVANAAAAPNLTTLVAAVKAADLVTTLSGPGPFTVFAPTNEAFGRLAPGTVDNLLKPENRPTLVKVLTYHVVPGTLSSAMLARQIAAGGGTATLTTVEGEPLTVTMTGDVFTLTDVSGNKSYIETPDVRQSNGMVHVVNGVVIPKIG